MRRECSSVTETRQNFTLQDASQVYTPSKRLFKMDDWDDWRVEMVGAESALIFHLIYYPRRGC
jgi:hypothetical protein